MSKPKTEPVDLRKAVVGQKLRLRNGSEVTLTNLDEENITSFKWESGGMSWRRDGRLWGSGRSEWDVVAILPLDKPAVDPGVNRLTRLVQQITASGNKALMKRAIKALEGVLP